MSVPLTVNDRHYELDTSPGISLLSALRDDLGLTGTRFGCGHGACGACVVLVDGDAVPSCTISLEAAVNKHVVTIEGLAPTGSLHPVQRAFIEEQAAQCGYCSNGMIMATAALLAKNPHPTDEQIREALDGNLCRCGAHLRILRAVKRAAELFDKERDPDGR